jgi:hypothetical protein
MLAFPWVLLSASCDWHECQTIANESGVVMLGRPGRVAQGRCLVNRKRGYARLVERCAWDGGDQWIVSCFACDGGTSQLFRA